MIYVIGKESVGKSRLIHSLTGKYAYSANFQGTTVACDCYDCGGQTFVDTPGIFRDSDKLVTGEILQKIKESDTVLLVAQATHLTEDLRDLLPLAAGKKGAVAVTFRDKIEEARNFSAQIRRLEADYDFRFFPLDARTVTDAERAGVLGALDSPKEFHARAAAEKFQPQSPRRTILENKYFGALLGLALIFLPAITAIYAANNLAGISEAPVKSLFAPLVEISKNLPAILQNVFIGNYGFLTMFPLLFVWALPTVLLYAFFLGFYKASGMLEKISVALHPLVRPFGLEGRDFLRVVMGFGCNVPAVVNTRSCSACTRGACVSAIAFGAACSYQFAATVGVFAAVQKPFLIVPFLGYLIATTLVYSRFNAAKEARSKRNLLVLENRTFLQMPKLTDVWREARATLDGFFRQAIPIFFLITIVASLLDQVGAINAAANLLAPLMLVFNLPSEAALPVIFASVRKDGILLFANQETLSALSSMQILTGVYLAGVALPCLVTALTIKREMGWRFAAKLVSKQLFAAIVFALVLAFAGKFLVN
jgi:ferrous iron transport protein B